MTKELTQGQKLVGLTFNPSGEPAVAKIKQKFADVIDAMYELEEAGAGSEGQLTCIATAITSAVTAQMWAVKALTWKD